MEVADGRVPIVRWQCRHNPNSVGQLVRMTNEESRRELPEAETANLKMLAAIGLFVIGFPGLVDDFVQWQDLLALASWWNVAFMITGFMLFIHGAFRWNFREQISKLRA